MVAVGGSNTPLWTRAFVYNTVTNIDYRSEALVHVVLQRLTRAPAVLYQQVITMRAVPWARLGLARALHLQKKQVTS